MSKEEDLLNLPKEIKVLEENAYKDVKLSEDMQKVIDEALATLEIDIASEKDLVTNKPTFSNVGARAAELTKRIGSDEKFTAMFQKQRELRDHSKANELELNYKLRMFSALKRLVDKRVE